MIRRSRRIATTILVIGTVVAGTVVTTGGAAHASGCHRPIPDMSFDNGTLRGHNWQFCFDPDSEIPLPVKIEKLARDSSPLPPDPDIYYWVIVAEGRGDVTYVCKGTVANTFRMNGGRLSGTYACS